MTEPLWSDNDIFKCLQRNGLKWVNLHLDDDGNGQRFCALTGANASRAMLEMRAAYQAALDAANKRAEGLAKQLADEQEENDASNEAMHTQLVLHRGALDAANQRIAELEKENKGLTDATLDLVHEAEQLESRLEAVESMLDDWKTEAKMWQHKATELEAQRTRTIDQLIDNGIRMEELEAQLAELKERLNWEPLPDGEYTLPRGYGYTVLVLSDGQDLEGWSNNPVNKYKDGSPKNVDEIYLGDYRLCRRKEAGE